MGKKIFVSYKYSDRKVCALSYIGDTTVRDYVNILQSKLDLSDHIYMGENDDESLETLADSTIGSKLGDKIFNSTVTIVFISKGMKDNMKSDRDQWIPWEIAYSLREQSRGGINSKTNALLAVVIPDEDCNYEYFMKYNADCNSTTIMTDTLFSIIAKNMFNMKNPETRTCNGKTIYMGNSSYIKYVKWNEFIGNIDYCIESTLEIWKNRNNYNVVKSV